VVYLVWVQVLVAYAAKKVATLPLSQADFVAAFESKQD
jgi:hypothetical protein